MGARASFKDLLSPAVLVNAGIITAWLRNAVTSGDVDFVADTLNAGNPATTNGTITGNADFSMTFSTGELIWPLVAANNQTQTFGVYMRLKRTGTTSAQFPWAIDIGTNGASARKVFFQKSTTNGIVRVYNATSTAARAATVTNAFSSTGQWDVYGVELDLGSGLAEDKRCVITINGVVQSFTGSTPLGAITEMPSAMGTPTGNFIIGSQGGSNYWEGSIARDIFVLGARHPARTEGLLPPAGRMGIVNYFLTA